MDKEKLKEFSVTIPVYSDVTVSVMAKDRADAKEKALRKAIDEEPLVSWLVDEMQEYDIYEV